MKILSVGNEFSSQAQTYLPFLAGAAGKELTACTLRLDGASIEDHYRNYTDEEEVYSYECFLPGETEKLCPDGIALHEAVEDDDWDIITLQQNGELSGDKESYKPYLAELAAYCKLMHPEAKIMVFQTWAYEAGSPDRIFREVFEGNQVNMYNTIARCCAEIKDEADADDIVPIGRAWQIARNSSIGDRLTTNGVDANELGEFLASCCLYEKIFNEGTNLSPFNLPGFSKATSDLLKICAHMACEEGIIKT